MQANDWRALGIFLTRKLNNQDKRIAAILVECEWSVSDEAVVIVEWCDGLVYWAAWYMQLTQNNGGED